jgi:serine/threonine protein kinase
MKHSIFVTEVMKFEGESMQEYTEKVDVYAFGIILWEIISRKHPYEDHDFKFLSEKEKAIRNGLRPTIPKHHVILFNQ